MSLHLEKKNLLYGTKVKDFLPLQKGPTGVRKVHGSRSQETEGLFPLTTSCAPIRKQNEGSGPVCLNLPSPSYRLYELEQITEPLHALVSTSFQWSLHSTYSQGLFWGFGEFIQEKCLEQCQCLAFRKQSVMLSNILKVEVIASVLTTKLFTSVFYLFFRRWKELNGEKWLQVVLGTRLVMSFDHKLFLS